MIFSSNDVTKSSKDPDTESPPVSMLNLGEALLALVSFFLFGSNLFGVDVEFGGAEEDTAVTREEHLAGVCC